MPLAATWSTLRTECEALEDATSLVTPLSENRIRITDVQEDRLIVDILDTSESRPLLREQFETLVDQVRDASDGFSLAQLPAEADPYPAVLSLHPHFEVDASAGVLRETDDRAPAHLVRTDSLDGEDERAEPDLAVYSDTLLLVDALERYDVTDLDSLETSTLVTLYTLSSDVQRAVDGLRQDVSDALLERVHDDQPVHGRFGSVRRTARTYRSLRDEADVLATLEDAGVPPERVTSIDSAKVDDALEVTTLTPSDVYEIEEREYVRKATVDDDEKQTRLQGLKDQLVATEGAKAEALRAEIEDLEGRIDDLTSFRSGAEV